MYKPRSLATITFLTILAFSRISFAQENEQPVNVQKTVAKANSLKDVNESLIPAVIKNSTVDQTISVRKLNASISQEAKPLRMRADFTYFSKAAMIDLTLKNIDVMSILRILAKEGGKNIVIDKSVKGTITAELKNVSLNEAMQTLLTSQELEARNEGNTIFVASRPAMSKKGLNRKLIKAFKLNNSNAVDIAKILEASIFNKGYDLKDSSGEKKDDEVSSEASAMQAVGSDELKGLADTLGKTGQVKASGVTDSFSSQSSLGMGKKISGRVEKLTPGDNFNDAKKPASEIRLQAVTSSTQDIDINNNDGSAIVIPDTRTNSILIAGLQEDLDLAEQTIKYLDKPLQQVSLEVSLIEISKEDQKDLGLSAYTENGYSSYTGFNTPMAGLTDPGNVAAISYSTINNLASGTTIRLKTLIKDKKVKLLAHPTIVALDGSESLIKITDRIVSKMDVTTSQGVVTYNATLEDIGIVLNILPKVSEDGYVTMRIRPSITSPLNKEYIGKEEDGAFATLVQTREVILQDVRVKAGETLSIAGLIKDSQTKEQGKIPLLSDLPIIGKIFSNTTDKKTKTELVILITPKLISENPSI